MAQVCALAGLGGRRSSILAAVHIAELTESQQRVLGCLIEKRWTTPDQYPLSLNALRLACNQSTNRDPVTDYDDAVVSDAAQRLARYGLARLASGHNSRATKYRHLAEEALGLGREQLAVLCVLLLRGSQTPGELKGRTERMAAIVSLDGVERILGSLAERGFVRRIDRRPGQKEDRYVQQLGERGADAVADAPAPPASADPIAQPVASSDRPGLAARVDALEAELATLRSELATLRSELAATGSELAALRSELGA
jgi:uncharacterized protein YceH (UPF0502 family)